MLLCVEGRSSSAREAGSPEFIASYVMGTRSRVNRRQSLQEVAGSIADSDSDSARAAAMYTLIATAKMDGFDPQAYLRDVLGIADHPIRIADLLPWNIDRARPRAAA